MITTIDPGPDVLAYRVDGTVERSDIDTAFAAMDQRIRTAARMRVYTKVVAFGGISLDALWEDLKSAPERWSAFSRIGRVAVVTDVEWMAHPSGLQGRPLPGMDVRTFRSPAPPRRRPGSRSRSAGRCGRRCSRQAER